MPIARATEADLAEIRRLFRSARYRFADYGLEDLPDLLAKSESVLGSNNGVLWGFLSLQTEERPVTLPPDAPSRSYLRALTLRGGHSPAEHAGYLLAEAVRRLRERQEAIQIITYGGERWMTTALHAAGFTVADQVQFFELTRPHRQLNALPPVARSAAVRPAEVLPAEPAHLEQLAELDAAAFPPLWHFGYKDMLELLMRARLQIAVRNDVIAGYTAAIANSSDEIQLARLAVRSELQGQGIGRQLLRDVVLYAASEQCERLILNTQTGNERSQHLYRAFGFRPVSKPAPVLTLKFT
jgi:ribosomal protein S18 acetylase RimI-like enzyme